MIRKIHIMGASGSGKTTLAKSLCQRLNYKCFDTDDFLWLKTEPPYQSIRPTEGRIELMQETFMKHDKWILSGGLNSWGRCI